MFTPLSNNTNGHHIPAGPSPVEDLARELAQLRALAEPLAEIRRLLEELLQRPPIPASINVQHVLSSAPCEQDVLAALEKMSRPLTARDIHGLLSERNPRYSDYTIGQALDRMEAFGLVQARRGRGQNRVYVLGGVGPDDGWAADGAGLSPDGHPLSPAEREIVEGLGRDTLPGKGIARRVGRKLDASLRVLLANLVQRGTLSLCPDGYFVPSARRPAA